MKATFLLDYIAVPPEKESTVYLLLKLESFAVEAEERKLLNISLVLDRSGSMAGTKLDYTRKAATSLVNRLASKDIVSLVVYDREVQTLVPPQQAKSKEGIRRKIQSISSGTTTNLSGGWLEGLGHVEKHLNVEKINRVLLLTDGLANEGLTDSERLKEVAQQWRNKGVSTTTLGFGDGFNEDLLAGMADAGGGSFYFIENSDQAPQVFEEELGELTTLVAQNIRVQAKCHPAATISRQLNEYPKHDENTWDFGDMFADEFKTMLFELKIAPQPRGERELLEVIFSYDQIYPTVEKTKIVLPIKLVVDEKQAADCGRNEEVIQEYMLLDAALKKKKAIELADRGEYGQSILTLQCMSKQLGEYASASPILSQEQNEIDQIAQEMQNEEYSPALRKKMRYQQVASQRAKSFYKKKK